MRKTVKSIMAVAASLFIGAMVACSGVGQPSPQDVAEKIETGEKLEEADYETMLDYLEEFVEVGEDSPNDYESGQAVAREYPYFLKFADKVVYAPANIKNGERYREIMQRYIILMNR